MSIKKLLFGFLLISLASIGSVVFTIYKMQLLSNNMLDLFIHPFQVNNSASEIYTSVTVMERDIKAAISASNTDVTNANLNKTDVTNTNLNNTNNIRRVTEKGHRLEKNIENNFAIIYQNYLGDNQDIVVAHQAFIQWKTVKEQVLLLLSQGENSQANQVLIGQGLPAVEHFYQKNQILKNFAVKKAGEYHDFSVVNSNINIVIIALTTTLFFSAFIIIYIVKDLFKINQKYQQQLYLLDQNILTATIAKDKTVTEVSHALCQMLKKEKQLIINSKSDWFFTDEQQFADFENEIYSGISVSLEVYIYVAEKKYWFNLEIIPQATKNLTVEVFNLFFNDITDKKALEKLSITDNMTGLYNRNYFDRVLSQEYRRAKRDEKLFSIVMLDIDFFKQYNDTYGHQQGDKALIAVAQVLIKHAKRSSDFAFRVGGEEFVILTNQKDFISLELFVLNIIHNIEALKISHEPSTVSEFLTISAGALQLGYKKDMTVETLYSTADKLLYQAKSAGRNGMKSLFQP